MIKQEYDGYKYLVVDSYLRDIKVGFTSEVERETILDVFVAKYDTFKRIEEMGKRDIEYCFPELPPLFVKDLLSSKAEIQSADAKKKTIVKSNNMKSDDKKKNKHFDEDVEEDEDDDRKERKKDNSRRKKHSQGKKSNNASDSESESSTESEEVDKIRKKDRKKNLRKVEDDVDFDDEKPRKKSDKRYTSRKKDLESDSDNDEETIEKRKKSSNNKAKARDTGNSDDDDNRSQKQLQQSTPSAAKRNKIRAEVDVTHDDNMTPPPYQPRHIAAPPLQNKSATLRQSRPDFDRDLNGVETSQIGKSMTFKQERHVSDREFQTGENNTPDQQQELTQHPSMETLAAILEVPALFKLSTDPSVTVDVFLQMGYKELNTKYGITADDYMKIKAYKLETSRGKDDLICYFCKMKSILYVGNVKSFTSAKDIYKYLFILSVISLLFASSYNMWTAHSVGRFAVPERCTIDLPFDHANVMLWQTNRNKILKYFNYTHTNSPEAIVIFGSNETVGNDGVGFIQNSDFMYISGITIPGAAIIIPLDSRLDLILVLPDKSTKALAFDGPYPPLSYLSKHFGVTMTISSHNISTILSRFSIVHTPQTYSMLPTNITQRHNVLSNALKNSRRTKSKYEIEILRHASKIAANAHLEVMKRASKSSSEYSLLSLFVHLSFICGARVQAYSPIAAFKSHASILHYQNLDVSSGLKPSKNDGLFLIDAAGSFMGYASDITRTYPVGRKWPRYGKEIYELVLEANIAGISMVKIGVSWPDVAEAVEFILVKGMKKLGFLKGKIDDIIDSKAIRVFMPHGLGHMVGIDVHDVEPVQKILQPGDVLTVEPGIYFNKHVYKLASERAKEYINNELVEEMIEMEFGGVRIEDVVLLTRAGREILSRDAPKSVKDIERLLEI